MQRSRRKRLLKLIARVDSARGSIVRRQDDDREFFARGALVIRELILLARRGRLLLAYLDDDRRAHR